MPKQPQVYQPDDRYFQQVMSNPEVAKDYIKYFYPDIASIADLDTLNPQKVKLLSPHLKLFSADVVYRCRLKAEKDAYLNFCLLFEHKSQPDEHVSVQVGLYIFLLMQDMVKQKGRKLEPVMPLLFYNGEKEWQPKTVRQLFQGFPHFEKLKSHLPDFEFLFEDAHRLPPGELLKLELSYFRTALMSMALKHRVDLIFQYFEVIFEGTSDKDERLATITYILGVAERHADEVMEALDQKESGTKSKVMSTLEQLLEKGRKEGRQQGQEVGKQKARVFNLLKTSTRFPQMSAVDLADITELEAEKVIGLFDQLAAPGQPELLGYIQAQFLPEIKLSTEESTKLNQLVADLLDSRR